MSDLPGEIYLSTNMFGNVECHFNDGQAKYTRTDTIDDQSDHIKRLISKLGDKGHELHVAKKTIRQLAAVLKETWDQVYDNSHIDEIVEKALAEAQEIMR